MHGPDQVELVGEVQVGCPREPASRAISLVVALARPLARRTVGGVDRLGPGAGRRWAE